MTINGTPFRVIKPPAPPATSPVDAPVSVPPAPAPDGDPTASVTDALRALTENDTPAEVPARSARMRRLATTVRADLGDWWLLNDRPASLQARWRQRGDLRARRVPDGNGLLKAVWVADDWTSGLVAYGLGVVLFLLAGGVWWLAGHPLRRWPALALFAVTFAWVVWG